MDGGDEKQEGQHGTVFERGLGLEGLMVSLVQRRADEVFAISSSISRGVPRLASRPAGVQS